MNSLRGTFMLHLGCTDLTSFWKILKYAERKIDIQDWSLVIQLQDSHMICLVVIFTYSVQLSKILIDAYFIMLAIRAEYLVITTEYIRWLSQSSIIRY